tara:strand:+ start:3137 stop:4894 length:1758 start_codon:yes stop_codon:yes gene_type:complete
MAHTLRKVDKDFSFDEQRVELNELALDVYNLKHDFDGLSLDDLVDVNAAGAAIQQIIKYNGTSWVLDTDIVSTSFSVQTNTASGGGALTYNNSTAIFQYTPPYLNGFLTSVALNDLTDVNTAGAQTGKIIKYDSTVNSGSGGWVVADDNTTVASAFISLTDTPSSLSAGKWLKVNAGGTDLEWTDAPSTGVTSFTGLNDTPGSLTANKWLKVNAGGTALEYTNEPTDTTYNVFSTTEDGLVPQSPGGTTKFLRADGTWDLPPTYTAFTGTDAGLVPASTSGESTKFLRSDGSWVDSPGEANVQSDWNQSNTSADDYIKNKPTLVTTLNGLTDVNTAGAQTDKILKYDSTANAGAGGWVVGDDATGGGSSGANVTISDTAPTSPSVGDLWFKSDEGRLKIYYQDVDTTQWVDTSPIGSGGGGGGSITVTTDDNAPSNPSDGDLWWKSDEGQLKVYYQDVNSSQWVDTGGSPLSHSPKLPTYLGEVELWNFGAGITWRGSSGITATTRTAEGGGGFQEAYVRLAFSQSYTSANDYIVQITVSDPSTDGHIYAPSIRKHLDRIDFNVQNLTSSVLATGWKASVSVISL